MEDIRNKLVVEFFKFDNSITPEYKEKLLKTIKKDEKITLRQLSKKVDIPLSTLHGYISRRDVYRKENPTESRGQIIKEVSTINQKLRTCLFLLKEIKEIDNEIGKKYYEEIKEQINRIEKKNIY